MNLDHLKEWINKFQTTRQHTHTPSRKVFKLSFWIWRHQSILFNNLPLFDEDKSLVCLCCCFWTWKVLQNRICAYTKQVYQQDTKAHKTSFLHKPLSRKTSQITIKTSAKMRLVYSRTMVNKSMATIEFKPCKTR